MTRTRRSAIQEATPKRRTIKDVAQAAGVSVSTVSNVLNGRVEAMAEETLLRIRETIQLLNYRPNGVARGLVNRRTATIGLIVAEIETPLFIQALNFIEPIARGAGYNVLVCNARNLDDERHVISLLLEKEVDGFIFLSTSIYSDDTHIIGLKETGRPAVLINRTMIHEGFDQINWDNRGGVITGVKHLAGLGHRRIAHLHGPENRRSSAERLQGYQRGLEECGLTYHAEYVRPGDYSGPRQVWQQSALELLALPEPPTALIASDDVVAAVAMTTVQRTGRRVPDDFAIVGIDDQPFSAYLNPALSTVQLPVHEAGKRAIDLLLARIAEPHVSAEQVMLPCPLVVRESCGAALNTVAGVDV